MQKICQNGPYFENAIVMAINPFVSTPMPNPYVFGTLLCPICANDISSGVLEIRLLGEIIFFSEKIFGIGGCWASLP